jgi:hypothetical protein
MAHLSDNDVDMLGFVALQQMQLIMLMALDDNDGETKRKPLGPGKGQVDRAPQRSYEAEDVFGKLEERGEDAFVDMFRFSSFELLDLCGELSKGIEAPRNVRCGVPPSDKAAGKPCKLDTLHRMLLVLDFLVSASKYTDLGFKYGCDKSVVSEELQHVLPVMLERLAYEIVLPDHADQLVLQGSFDGFDSAVFAVDASYQRVARGGEDYSGHRHAYVRSFQVACTKDGTFVFCETGLLGRRHDLFNFETSALNLDDGLLAPTALLLADSAYASNGKCQGPLSRFDVPDRVERKELNKQHSSQRIIVEHAIGFAKSKFAILVQWRAANKELGAQAAMAALLLSNRLRRLRRKV